MQKLSNQLLLTKDDYKVLTSYLHARWGKTVVDRKNAEDLQAELEKAKIVDKEKFPTDVVRLNSKVTIKAEDKNETIELTLVTPDKANIKEKKISVLAPIGTALLGFREGNKIKWQVPAGKKTFTILQVTNGEG
ncbi:MAG: nucleoside diphosphate kinase regulator [Chitinophagaceae bacterium]